MIYENITQCIGKTPLVELKNIEKQLGLKARLLAKIEYFNPAGSIKDRTALAMIEDGEKRGKIGPKTVIIEPTSGNTGIGLAAICAVRGYRLILTMPETMSVERRKMLSVYGAEIVLTDGSRGMRGAIERAEELLLEYPDSFMPSQFENMANPAIHRKTTGPEIWADCGGKLDFFVASVGTGGTITGIGEYLKSKNENIRVLAVEPKASSVLRGFPAGPHRIQGIGAGFIPKALNTDIYDDVFAVTDEDAFAYARLAAKREGLLVGISSGAALKAACDLAIHEKNEGKTVVVVFPDSGDRYFSTPIFEKA